MRFVTKRVVIVFALLTLHTQVTTQPANDDAILFVWNDVLWAQAINRNELVEGPVLSMHARTSLPIMGINSFSIEQSPLNELPSEGYGFHQGLWSPNRTMFVYLAIESDGPGYRLISVHEERHEVLFSGTVDHGTGYMVPLGWTDSGTLILLERYMLHNLREVRLWQYDPDNQMIEYIEAITIPELKGNNVALPGGWAFLGFDTIGQLGYLLNLNTRQLTTFPTSFALVDPPSSVFELYPIQIIGTSNFSDFNAWLIQRPTEVGGTTANAPPSSSTPFLHWPLPDHARSVTCYPDSEWTRANFPVTCPGLAPPRAYQGHEGTDIGGKPDGLTNGTPVYAAARGIVVKTLSICPSNDITCGNSYGNHVLIEHTRVNAGNTETWFTGYAHLQTVLVEPYHYVDEIGVPIALSGDTGFGGAHLHFEVRSPEQPVWTHWIDVWDNRLSLDGSSLWVGGNTHPVSAVQVSAPPTQVVCQTGPDSNIRSGPGTDYDVVGKTAANTDYEVFQIQYVEIGQARGDWYHVRWGNYGVTGWLWSGLMDNCAPASHDDIP